jgi:hypothetical protein
MLEELVTGVTEAVIHIQMEGLVEVAVERVAEVLEVVVLLEVTYHIEGMLPLHQLCRIVKVVAAADIQVMAAPIAQLQ